MKPIIFFNIQIRKYVISSLTLSVVRFLLLLLSLLVSLFYFPLSPQRWLSLAGHQMRSNSERINAVALGRERHEYIFVDVVARYHNGFGQTGAACWLR
jgi:hypothetical protein